MREGGKKRREGGEKMRRGIEERDEKRQPTHMTNQSERGTLHHHS